MAPRVTLDQPGAPVRWILDDKGRPVCEEAERYDHPLRDADCDQGVIWRRPLEVGSNLSPPVGRIHGRGSKDASLFVDADDPEYRLPSGGVAGGCNAARGLGSLGPIGFELDQRVLDEGPGSKGIEDAQCLVLDLGWPHELAL